MTVICVNSNKLPKRAPELPGAVYYCGDTDKTYVVFPDRRLVNLQDFFAEIAEGANGGDRLQEYAVQMLGITKDKSITPLLRRLLSTSEHLSVKAQAAECLAWLDGIAKYC